MQQAVDAAPVSRISLFGFPARLRRALNYVPILSTVVIYENLKRLLLKVPLNKAKSSKEVDMFVFNLNRFFKTSKKSILLPVLACVFLAVACGKDSEDDPAATAGPVISAWTRLVGAAGKATNALAVAVDGEGYSYITGFTTGTIDPDRTGSVIRDAFIARYDRDGERLWIKQLGYATMVTAGQGIAVDKSGNSYVAGWTTGNLEAGSGSATGSSDFFVAKYDKEGGRLWVKQLGVDDKSTAGFAVAVDNSGNTYITGYTNGDLDGAGPGTLTGAQDIFVAKYDTSGVQQWVKQLGALSSTSQGRGIAVDQAGNSYATGLTTGDLDSGVAGTYDVFIVKYDTSGNKKWVIQKGVSEKETQGFGIAVDASGNCHVTGYTKGDLGGPGTLVGDKDVFVMKYDTAGQFKWLKQTSESGKDAVGYGIALDSAGNCYATGITNADLDGAGPNVFKGDNELFVIAYDTNGASLWIRQMASSVTSNDLKALGIAATRNGTCIVAGYVTENFDEQSLTGSSDAFITTKLNK